LDTIDVVNGIAVVEDVEGARMPNTLIVSVVAADTSAKPLTVAAVEVRSQRRLLVEEAVKPVTVQPVHSGPRPGWPQFEKSMVITTLPFFGMR